MRAYKGFRKHEDGTLWCRDFQYEVGKTYTFDSYPILCEQGFHACHNLHQCWVFYPNNGENVYYEVECGGRIVESGTDDGKLVCTEITLVKEIPTPKNKFDYCSYFCNGYANVLLNGRCNFINTDGKFISKQWFDYCRDFHNGFAEVELDDKCNFINADGKYLSEQWFDGCTDFYGGYANVLLKGKYCKLYKNGKITEFVKNLVD